MTAPIPAWVDGTLIPYEKLAVHKEGLRHKAVSVFVLNQGQILLQRRALGKYHTPGLWANTCCTHPNWGESALDCAHRRLDEELGIRGLECEFRHGLEYRADVGNGLIEHEVVDVFVAVAPDNLKVTPNPEEVMETRWTGFSDLLDEVKSAPEWFTPWLRIYMDDYADKIFDAKHLTESVG